MQERWWIIAHAGGKPSAGIAGESRGLSAAVTKTILTPPAKPSHSRISRRSTKLQALNYSYTHSEDSKSGQGKLTHALKLATIPPLCALLAALFLLLTRLCPTHFSIVIFMLTTPMLVMRTAHLQDPPRMATITGGKDARSTTCKNKMIQRQHWHHSQHEADEELCGHALPRNNFDVLNSLPTTMAAGTKALVNQVQYRPAE